MTLSPGFAFPVLASLSHGEVTALIGGPAADGPRNPTLPPRSPPPTLSLPQPTYASSILTSANSFVQSLGITLMPIKTGELLRSVKHTH